MTKFKYVHLYLGAKMIDTEGNIYEILQVSKTEIVLHSNDGIGRISPDNTEFKLLLKPLSSMTEEEMNILLKKWYSPNEDIFSATYDKIEFKTDEPQRHIHRGEGVGFSLFSGGKHQMTGTLSFTKLNSTQFLFLLSKSFDLFGLIENSEAIDATKEGV